MCWGAIYFNAKFQSMVVSMEEKKPVKVYSRIKRLRQSQERCARNRSFRAMVSTASRRLKEAVAQKKTDLVSLLGKVHSLIDKGYKKGVFPRNKASRMKASASLVAFKAS